MLDRILKTLIEKTQFNFTRLAAVIAITITVLSMIVLFIGAKVVKEKAIHDLAKYDARQITQFIFQSLYSAMSKGWTKGEIKGVIERLNRVEPDMKIEVLRGFPVIEQFGEMPGEREMREKDPLIMKAIKGEESLIREDNFIHYYYPIIAQKECRRCHDVEEGDINGMIKVSYPVHNLKISLNFLVNLGLASFTLFLIIIFLLFYFSVKLFLIKPILSLVGVINDIIAQSDLNKRIPETSYISEILHLTNHFNKLLHTVQDYYQKLEELAVRDPLTKFYNRRKFEEYIEHEINRSSRHNHKFAIIMIDLDNFKYINDTYGHPVGDIVLKGTASFIEQNIRNTDIPARIGGDEFSVILPETSIESGMVVAEKIRKAMRETPINIMTGDVLIKASFGVAEYPLSGKTMKDILTSSDVALYRAKHLGKDHVVMIEGGETEVKMDKVSRGETLKRALEEDRVEPFFQPVIDIVSGDILALDVMARIKEGDSYMLAGQFKSTAEELGYMEQIDTVVFEKGILLYRSIQERYCPGKPLKLFFELPSKRFFAEDFLKYILEVLTRHNVSGDRIVFEIEEHETLPHINKFIELANKFKGEGIRFLLKNFGSGFSSFMYLKYLDVSYVKIDGELIRNIEIDNRNRILVANMHQILSQFNIKDVAPQVEGKDPHDVLREIGISYGQGFYYAPPEAFKR